MIRKTGGRRGDSLGGRARALERALACCLLLVAASELLVQSARAQDILRQRIQTHQQQSQQQLANNPLANIQLPPQLASLTPQQLHQLAQLRELQLQQQAAQQQQQQQQAGQNAPAPGGADTSPTSQPASSNNAQIPQPTATSSSSLGSRTDSSDRHDHDGAYNESSSEMEGVTQSGAGESGAANSAPAASAATSPAAPAQATAAASPTFEVNWNKCPQLEPSESEKGKKTQVITKCLQAAPIPANLTRENVEAHREQIATCALKVEGWFDEQGSYRYDKAESEIRAKRLNPEIENQVLKFHVACREEAGKKFPRDQNKLIDQVQFYQACMDYYISIVCEIEVSVDQ